MARGRKRSNSFGRKLWRVGTAPNVVAVAGLSIAGASLFWNVLVSVFSHELLGFTLGTIVISLGVMVSLGKRLSRFQPSEKATRLWACAFVGILCVIGMSILYTNKFGFNGQTESRLQRIISHRTELQEALRTQLASFGYGLSESDKIADALYFDAKAGRDSYWAAAKILDQAHGPRNCSVVSAQNAEQAVRRAIDSIPNK